MRFVLQATALNVGDDGVLALIDRLIDRMADEVHLVDMEDADLLEASRWFHGARPTRRKLLMSALARPPRRMEDHPGPHRRVVQVMDAESAKRAEKLAHAPLVILLEDRESDGVLLDIVVDELGWPELKALWEHGRKVTPRATELETAGGKDAIRQRVERAVSDAAQEDRPLRLFVFCDSDSRWPGHDLPSTDAIREACKKHDVPNHILEKRSAENYIPDEVLASVREDPRNLSRRESFHALLRRSSAQRDHFPVKDGLSADERAAALAAGLYDASEEDDLMLLERPLFPKRPRPLLLLNQERRGAFTASGLRSRDGGGELDALLHAIAQEL